MASQTTTMPPSADATTTADAALNNDAQEVPPISSDDANDNDPDANCNDCEEETKELSPGSLRAHLRRHAKAIDQDRVSAVMLVLGEEDRSCHADEREDDQDIREIPQTQLQQRGKGKKQKVNKVTPLTKPQRNSHKAGRAIPAADGFRSMPLPSTKNTKRSADQDTYSQPLTCQEREQIEHTLLRRGQDSLVSTVRLPGAFRVSGMGSSRLVSAEEDDCTVSKPFSVSDSMSFRFGDDPIRASLVSNISNEDLLDLERALDVAPLEVVDESNEPEEEKTTVFSRRFTLALRAMVLLWVLVFSGALVWMEYKPDSTSSDPKEETKDEPTVASETGAVGGSETIFYPPFDENLPALTIKKIHEDPTSPQYKANAWVVQDPELPNLPVWRQQQRFSMAVHYFATNGMSWANTTNWLSYTVSECEWYSTVDAAGGACDERGRLVVQELSDNGLSGSMVQDAQLPYLIKVDLSFNHLQGMLPVLGPGRLFVEEFILSQNKFEGPLIVSAGMSAPDLRIVKLDNNNFSGNITMAMPLFPKLEVWNVANNLFEGTLPSALGLLSSLKELDLSGNQGIGGPIPNGLSSLSSSLELLDISGTSVTGDIPEGLCLKHQQGELEINADCSRVRCCK